MSSGALVSLRCPDCAKSLGPPEGHPTCPGCARAFAPSDGVWDLPPSLKKGDTDKEKYTAIGESDRMTLKLVKAKKK